MFYNVSFGCVRELERTRAELLDRTKEYEAILSMKERLANVSFLNACVKRTQ